ncbi:hypothetical protein GCM10010387_16270 [Streptomyces inusitatus]|uniref:Uncharacterized protein n=1 Tax=Streptomyces inusitatus TaxID=68221 RepID=A0A918PWU8_9ACTN|nr:hypothetical protein [Streptomyces inusitatus]GGZ23784.1 hypothetical protein GCM10010387_16270 [Streptomyces inusitatus]
MNPDYLPPLGACLRKLGEYATRHDVNDSTLAEISADLDQARALVAGARGQQRANRCTRHPGSPVDPSATNGCLFCGNQQRRPAAEIPSDLTPAEVLAYLDEHGHQAAVDRYGGRALARALSISQHPSNTRLIRQADEPDHRDEGETTP